MGCLTLHNASTVTLPEQGDAVDVVLNTQRGMSKCLRGARRWRACREHLREEKRRIRSHDHDVGRKASKTVSARLDVLGHESVKIGGRDASAKGGTKV